MLPSWSSLTRPSYTLTSSACGIATPSVVVKSRLAGSATKPTARVFSLLVEPPPEPDEQPAAVMAKAAVATPATRRLSRNFTRFSSWQAAGGAGPHRYRVGTKIGRAHV